MHLYVYDCVIHWDLHVGYSGSRCCAHNFGTAGCRNNGLSEHCHGTLTHYPQRPTQVSSSSCRVCVWVCECLGHALLCVNGGNKCTEGLALVSQSTHTHTHTLPPAQYESRGHTHYPLHSMSHG